MRYIAQDYRWGGASCVCVVRENQCDLMTHGSTIILKRPLYPRLQITSRKSAWRRFTHLPRPFECRSPSDTWVASRRSRWPSFLRWSHTNQFFSALHQLSCKGQTWPSIGPVSGPFRGQVCPWKYPVCSEEFDPDFHHLNLATFVPQINHHLGIDHYYGYVLRSDHISWHLLFYTFRSCPI